MRASRFLVLFSLALMLASTGCMRRPAPRPIADAAPVATQPAAEPPPVITAPQESAAPAAPMDAMAAAQFGPGGEPAYLLDSGDKLRVVVFGQEGLSNSYAVDAAGNITMPLIGAVYARAHTPAALSAAIAGKLRNGYIREPHVAVEIEAYRPFFILGEVTAPGQYPYVPNMTAETAIAIAGGFTPRADRKRVEVSRAADGQMYRGKVPLPFPLHPGDTILVSERWF
jgi:polysaccharide biosynthesis/export protein